MKRLAAVALCLASLTSWTSVARADPAAEARFHDDAARQHYEKARFQEALREFFLEQRLAPNPRIAFNIALCFQQLARKDEAFLDQAFLYYSEYLNGDDDNAQRRTAAAAAVAEIEPRVARVEVVSEPPGASIFVDKREHGEYGVAPRVLALPEGEHHLWLTLDGYHAAEQSVLAKRGALVKSTLSLARIVGTLNVSAPAAGTAEVRSADGELLASGPVPLAAPLPPGTYEVLVNARGFAPWRGLGVVKAERQTALAAEPARLAAASGEVTVTANISGALIRVDRQPAGFSPAVIPGVRAGQHLFSVSGAGVVPWSDQVLVRPDERAWVTVNLEPPRETQRSVATWLVGGLGVAGLGAAGVMAIVAGNTHSEWESAAARERPVLAERGQTYNRVADGLLIGGAVATGVSVLLYVITKKEVGRPSSATIARSAR